MTLYTDSLLLLTALVAMVVIQSFIATLAHRKQTQYIPGVVAADLDHHSFVFRSHRTFMNSMENVPLFILTAILAMFLNFDATTLYWTVLIYFVARLIHMVLFYKIATNKNPSPRSYFYMIALLTQFYLLGAIFVTA